MKTLYLGAVINNFSERKVLSSSSGRHWEKAEGTVTAKEPQGDRETEVLPSFFLASFP
jgi:hypothetical protein